MKAFGYCRVSTTDQQDEGVSLSNQQERIKAWAAANGHDLAGMYVEARSGGRADNRPELKKAMAAACRDGGILVVYSLSRFSRSVRDTLALADQLERAGANLASLSESLDTSTPVGRMFFQLMSVLSEFERNQLRQRTTSAMSHLRQHNKRISSKIPMGYDLAKDGVTLLPHTTGSPWNGLAPICTLTSASIVFVMASSNFPSSTASCASFNALSASMQGLA
jgi:site-specific DNA recombinase